MFRPATLGLLAALTLSAPIVATAAERPVATQLAKAPSAPVAATPNDAADYAQREQQEPQVVNYEGGSVIVVGLSGGALVVLLLILLLL